MTPPALRCGAKTYNDGSWYCALCGRRGDAGDDIDEWCNLDGAIRDMEMYINRPSRASQTARSKR